MEDKRFNIGDKVTYKDMKDCVRRNGDGVSKGGYYYDGDDQSGFVGEVLDYVSYVEDMDCWRIFVRCNISEKAGYLMLESEFLEYDKQPSNELFPIY